jgi:hypothetical protein
MGPFRVPSGGEVYKCQTFANPFGGRDAEVQRYESHMSAGSHHMFLFFDPSNQNGAVGDCPEGGLEFHPYPFTTQSPDADFTYPNGIASFIKGSTGFMLNGHFINTTHQDNMATVTVILHLAPAGSQNQHAGVIFMNDLGITIPPTAAPEHAGATCTIPFDLNLLASASHMHQHATHFVATAATSPTATTLYQTDVWADPSPMIYSPALPLKGGTAVTYDCTYVNDTGQTLVFGESALSNVMCIFSAQYYPVPADRDDPTISCMGI